MANENPTLRARGQNRTTRKSRPPQKAAGYLFTGARAELFKYALSKYPNARRDCLKLMRQHLGPRSGDHVLGFGEGSGFFCSAIAQAVGPTGKYVITEPSPELFCNIPQAVLDLPQVFTEITPVEDIHFPPESFDKAWACGAFHHCNDQTRALTRIYRSLKVGGQMVIFDIFQGTPLAKHFDTCVARYCETGHEVKFLSEEFAKTLCVLAGFDESNLKIVDVPHRLCFRSQWEMGDFIYNMHALTRMDGSKEERILKTISSLREHLTIEVEGDQHVLHFDQKGLIAIK